MRCFIALGLLAGCYEPSLPAGAPCPDDVCPNGLVCSPATKTCEHESVPADAGPDGDPGATTAVRYRRRISITNTAAVALPAGFTIRVAIPTMLTAMIAERKVKPDFSDLRVIGDGAIAERDRVVDPGSGSVPASLSFALQAPLAPGATTTDYALYYGGAEAAPALARGGNVFPVYDDFAAGISPIWLRNDAPAVVGGKLVLRAGHLDALTSNAATDGIPTISALEISARVNDPTSEPTPQGSESFYYWFGYQRTGDFTAAAPWALWVARGKATIRAEQKSPVGCETPCEGPTAPQSGVPHYYVIERDPAVTRFYLDGVLSYTATVINNADYAIMVRNYLATSDVVIDWIRARARVSPDPTVTVLGEEAL